MTTVKDVLNVVLQDNASGMGGVSFDGETVGDMYEEAELSLSDSVDMLNDLLKDLGIKPIK
ncbi:gp17 [Brochothrix phage A9]|uniref:Gp17 n=1 Tax=Brochothrix phage A9 TaxID=857312 RepID=D9J0G4_9CAUD|nr:gp17 [Brochothrix phage A9]ADJ53059.1 gp17 [Brochothrix phage A9]